MTRFNELAVGNDVIDLRDPDAMGKHDNSRWLARVLSERELADFEHGMTHIRLWRLWAAKESAFKVVKKMFGTSPSAKNLVVRGGDMEEEQLGVVDTDHGPIYVRWTVDSEFIHCVAWWPQGGEAERRIASAVRPANDPSLEMQSLTPREAWSAKNPASVAVRSIARSLMPYNGTAIAELEIIRESTEQGFGPPRFERDGRILPGYDLSLSHHGRFVAAAVSHPPGASHHG